jgi:hypothetical protein
MPPSATPVAYSDISYAYNRLYTDRRTTDSAERDHPRFYRTPKQDGLEGEGLFYRIIYGDPQGIASGEANFSQAQSSVSGVEGKQLPLTAQIKYGIVRLGGRAIRRAKKSKAAIYDLVTRHTDGTNRQIGADLALDLLGDGAGIRGQISALPGSNVITLTNKWQVDLFKKNMIIRASTGANGITGLRTGETFVTKVLRGSSQIVVNSTAGITGLAVNDYLFRKGDPGNLMQGLGVSTPLVGPTPGDTFRGIDRSDDVELLAGWRISDTNRYAEENILDLSALAFAHGKMLTEADVQPQTFANMVKRLGAKVMYEKGRTADVGFRFIEIHGSGTSVKVFSEPDLKDPTISRLYNPEGHEIRYTGGDGLVHTIRDDGGQPALRMNDQDAIEIRLCSEHEYLQYDPGLFGVTQHAQ